LPNFVLTFLAFPLNVKFVASLSDICGAGHRTVPSGRPSDERSFLPAMFDEVSWPKGRLTTDWPKRTRSFAE